MKTASFQCRLGYTYNVLCHSLVSQVRVKQLKGHERMGDVSVGAHHSSLNCFGIIQNFRGISFQGRYFCAAKKPITPG